MSTVENMAEIPTRAPDGDSDTALQAEIDAYCTKAGIGIPALYGLTVESVKEFCKYGIDIEDVYRLATAKLSIVEVKHFLEGGITNPETMIELHEAGVLPLAVLPYKEAGITDIEELKALGELGMGGSLIAKDIQRCGFTTYSEIIAAKEVSKENGAEVGRWSGIRNGAKFYGKIGKRVAKVHPLPKTTTSILSSKKIRRELNNLDDQQLKVVIKVIEHGETITLREARAIISTFQ